MLLSGISIKYLKVTKVNKLQTTKFSKRIKFKIINIAPDIAFVSMHCLKANR